MTAQQKIVGALITVGVIGLLGLGAFVIAESKKQEEMVNAEAAQQQAQSHEQTAAPRVTVDREAIAALIAGQNKFSVCKNTTLEFFTVREADKEVSYSFKVWSRRLRVLESLGYIKPSDAASEYFLGWLPTAKAYAAMNHQMRQEISSPTLDINFGSGWGSYNSPAYGRGFVGDFGNKEAKFYRWTMVLGCREFLQIDAMTPLADGSKVDFSWHWKVTDLALLDGLSDKRQRGEAYLSKSQVRVAVDQMNLKETE